MVIMAIIRELGQYPALGRCLERGRKLVIMVTDGLPSKETKSTFSKIIGYLTGVTF